MTVVDDKPTGSQEQPERAGQEPNTPPAAGQTSGGQEPPETFSREYVEQLRREAAENRRKAQEAQAKLDEHEKAQLSEKERAERERDEARALAKKATSATRTALLRAEVRAVSAELGLVDWEAALALLPTGAVEYDDDGVPSGIEAALKALAEAKPYLVKPAEGDEPARGGNPANPDRGRSRGGQTFTQAQLNDPEFYAKHRHEIHAAARKGQIR